MKDPNLQHLLKQDLIEQDAIKQVVIKQATWQQAEAELREVRTKVFIEEQLVTPEFEWDDIDNDAVHLLATHKNQAVGCLRIIHFTKIGRMAVLSQWRGLGIGNQLLNEAITVCSLHGSKRVDLSAQTHAIGFYRQAGFQTVSEEYTDVQIPHVDMRLTLD